MTLPLFDPAPRFDRAGLARRLAELARDHIWIGTSSWKYEGWLDQIYTRERYLTRGKHSRKRFEAECLAEYAEVFPVVCGDFSFYQFPAPDYWARLFASAPASLRFVLKAPEEITVERFPRHPRYGPRAGLDNPLFLDAGAFTAQFLEPLQPYRERLGPLIFEFGRRGTGPAEFTAGLDGFLDRLPDSFRYAVEVRNRELLGRPYFDCLRAHGVAHVFNSWTRMPALEEQFRIEDAFTAEFLVSRVLLRPGREYAAAVARFEPYGKVQDENPEARRALRDLIRRMRQERRSAYIFVNNRFEGNAPETIQAIVAD